MRTTSGQFLPRGAGTTRRGLTPKEKAVMERWDGGQPIRQIARELGRDVDRVRNTVIYYDGAADHRIERGNMAACSAALLRAIQRERV